MINWFGKLFPVIIFILFFSVFTPNMARALTLIPPTLEFGVEPGGTIISKIKVLNESGETTSLYTSAANFTAKDETGNPYFLFDEQGGLADWIKMDNGPIMLLPGEKQDVAFNINIPKNAEPGGYYAAIFFSTSRDNPEEKNEGGQVSVVSKVGTLVILRVSGDTSAQNALQEFHILSDKNFFTRLPVNFWYRLRNTGNVHSRPVGSVEIRNIFGMMSAKVKANPSEGAVLPDSVRRFEPLWQKKEPIKVEYRNFLQNFFGQAMAEAKNFAFGRYTARLNFTNIPEANAGEKISFWVLPWHLLLLSFIILFGGGFIARKGVKKYNKWIIEKARTIN